MKGRIKICIALLLCLFSIPTMANVVYVDASNINGSQDGTTWASAYYSFQFAMDYGAPGDTVWVAAGTYSPIANASFTMHEGLKIFGGFLNTDTSFAQRNVATRVTTLRGNGASVIKNDGSTQLTVATVLDGFTITNGQAASGDAGGGIHNIYASPTINNCIFISNKTSYTTFVGGGAICNDHSSPVITNCVFTSNSCPIFNGSGPNASGLGGGGAIANNYSSPIIQKCIFGYNTSTNYGGAIFNTQFSTPVISYCSFSNNQSDYGGAIYNQQGSSLNIDSCTFKLNRGNWGGGAIMNDTLPSTSITRCSFIQNSNGGYGGGAIKLVKNAVVIIDSSYFLSNSSNADGGSIFFKDCAASISNSTFTRNNSSYSGGAVSATQGVATVNNCSFTENATLMGNGGAMSLYGAGKHQIFNSTFTKDSSGRGGALSITAADIYNCTFNQNFSGTTGGGIEIAYVDTISTINASSFTGNNAGTKGGALYYAGGKPTISNCNFTQNSIPLTITAGTGGAVYADGYLAGIITSCNFSGNIAATGGAVSGYTGPISYCTFTNNAATKGGALGGLSTLLINSTFTGNNANYGGAVYTTGFPIKNCLFTQNRARRGGAINAGIGADNYNCISITNCIFAKNIADTFGGAMFNSYPPKFVTNSTFVGNVANVEGGGIYNTNYGNYTEQSFTNCIVWGNNTGVYNQNTASSAFSYGLIQGLGAFPAKHLLAGTANPMFVDTASGNYQLLAGSVCIDKGNNAAVDTSINTDIIGNDRIYNSIVDFGAYEFDGSAPLATSLISFTGHLQNENASLLQWEINANEVTNMELQRSNDGKGYNTIYSVTSDGSGDAHYSFVDATPQSSNYYRLQLTAANGSIHFSNVIFIGMHTAQFSSKVYPNPAKESVNIVVNDESLLNTTAIITDISGNVMQAVRIESKLQLISLSNLVSGIYLLKMQNGEVAKIVKQ